MEDPITVEEFAAMMGIKPRNIYNWINAPKKKIPVVTVTIGRKSLHSLPIQGLIEWTESQLDDLDRQKAKLLKVRQQLIERKGDDA